MFKDTKIELDRLQEELLEEEQPLARQADPRVYNSDRVDTDLQEFGEQVESPAKERLTGLAIAAILLTGGIVAIVIWWLVRLLG